MAGGGAWVLSGVLSPLPHWVALAVLALAGLLLALQDLGIGSLRLPERTQQVPQTVFSKGVLRGAWRFGLELGLGVRTRVPSGAAYFVALALLLLKPTLLVALLAGAAFGMGRALMPVLRYQTGDGENWDCALSACLGWLVPASTLSVVVALTTGNLTAM